MRFLFILFFCMTAFTAITATELFAQRDMPSFGDPTKMKKYQPDPSLLPPGYVPPEDGITDLRVMRLNKLEAAQRVEMSCSTEAIYTAYRTTLQRDNKYHFNDPNNEYLFVVDGLIPVPRSGYSFSMVLESVKRDTAFLRLRLIAPPAEKEDLLKVPMKLAVNTKIALGKNPITAAVIQVEGSGMPSEIKCSKSN